MSRRSLTWVLLPSFLAIAAISLSGVAWIAVRDMTRFYYERKSSDLGALARVAADGIAQISPGGLPGPGAQSDLRGWCGEFGDRSGTRVTVIRPSGKVLCDSARDPALMDNHSDRPEIRAAVRAGKGMSVRYSHTLEKTLMYVAVPIFSSPDEGVVRVALPVSTLSEALWTQRVRLGFGAIVFGILVALLSVLLSRRITAPLRAMREAAKRFGHGDFSARLPVPRVEEFAGLAEEMNRMAGQLDDRIRAVLDQRNELEAILSSMTEGVVALDADERVISLNQAAARMLGTDPDVAQSRTIQEVVRNADLQEFVTRTISSPWAIEGEIILGSARERTLQLHGTPLLGVDRRRIGAVVVLNDVSKIRRLERVRRDFVANASHEIRTPITSIKGFVETLLDGALEDRETAERFLHIILRHSDRLNAIVEDLLNLSKAEDQTDRGEVSFEEVPMKEILHQAVTSCSIGAEEKNISVPVQCPDGLTVKANPSLLAQAIINLIENGIMYSAEGSEVEVSALRVESKILISVRDQGCGIEKTHLSRIFERFYRVDQARSRSLGGTGLGLAIVKHIAQAHGGDVKVISTPGIGSTFTITLPALE
ncbi:MAG: HAMP domain-containing protein [Deltaproteobacteria bacterium]|nr:HAMP domain-containing protein [Deltaproteobacteria bacterium]